MKLQWIALLVLCALPAFAADEKPAAAGAMDPKKQEMMKKYMEYSTPGPQHKMLADLAGTWKYVSKMWETKDSTPQESKGTSTFKSILGGRYLQQNFKGKAMGMPFEGLGLMGYNNITKKFETLWLDNMATGMMQGEGTFDEATKTLTDKGEFSCPLSKDSKQQYRSEWVMKDKNHSVFSMYGHGPDTGGPEFKMMEITYERGK